MYIEIRRVLSLYVLLEVFASFALNGERYIFSRQAYCFCARARVFCHNFCAVSAQTDFYQLGNPLRMYFMTRADPGWQPTHV